MFFRAYLGWSLKHVAQNYLFYLFIAMWSAKMSRVNKALKRDKGSGTINCGINKKRIQFNSNF